LALDKGHRSASKPTFQRTEHFQSQPTVSTSLSRTHWRGIVKFI